LFAIPTTPEARMDRLILAIDLGKFNSVFCWFDPASRRATFRSVPSAPAEFRKLLALRDVARVVVEAGATCGWVSDLCDELGIACAVANTNAAAWQWKNVKRKTDRDDALKLARLAAADELPTVVVPPPAVRRWKSLIGLRKRLVGERVRVQNRIRSVLCGVGLPAPVGRRAWSELGLAGLAQHARPLADCDLVDFWRGELDLLLRHYRQLCEWLREVEDRLDRVALADADVVRLQTVPGVGPRTAEVVVTHLGDARRFRTADEVSAYAGLVPRQYQSGQTDRRGRIDKRGPRLLRAALVEGAWCCVRYNRWARRVWTDLRARGVGAKKAIVAVARKLLVRCWAMLKRQQDWHDPEPAVAVAAG
jgi:transposase